MYSRCLPGAQSRVSARTASAYSYTISARGRGLRFTALHASRTLACPDASDPLLGAWLRLSMLRIILP